MMNARRLFFTLTAILLASLFALACSAESAVTRLTVYDGPATMQTSENATVSANGNDLFVYDVMVNHEHIWNANTQPSSTPMTYFDFEGTVELDVTVPGIHKDIESAAVLPTSAGIVPEVSDGHVRFVITEPGQYTVICNDSVNKAVHIFANALETEIPDAGDPNVLFIGPGEWEIDTVVLEDDMTLYLSGGAVLHSSVVARNASNVRICGRGIIDGSPYPAHNQPGSYAHVPVDISGCKNVSAEGIILANANCWNFNVLSSRNVTINNVKVISGRQNGDGFTFQSCRDLTAENCFARTWDDTLVLKNYSASTQNITFRNIQVWTDLAQSMEIGYETNKGLTIDPEISNVLFEDITVLYNFHKPVISIHNSDDAYVHDITYRNIMVENAFMQGDNGKNNELIEMTLQNSGWSTVTDEFGKIDHVLIDGLTVLRTPDGSIPNSHFSGHNDKYAITDVTMRNINICGQPITSLKELHAITDDYCRDLNVEYDVPKAEAAEAAPAVLTGNVPTEVTVVTAPAQSGPERPECFPDPSANFIKLPETENLALKRPVSAGLIQEVYTANNVVDGNETSYWESKGFPTEITITLDGTHTIQTVGIRLNPAAIWEARVQAFSVEVSTDGETFTEAAANAKYEFNPDTGNIVRVDFPAVDAAYVKLIFTSNSSSRSAGAQAAEILIFE